MSVLKYFAKHSFIRIGVYGLGIAMVFVITPYIMRCMGESAYGVWALISSLSAYYLVLDCGLLRTVSKKGSESFALGDLDNVRQIYAAAIMLAVVTFIIVLIVGGILAILSKYADQSAVEPGYLAASIFAFSAFVGIALIARPAQALLAAAMHWNFIALVNTVRLLFSSLGVLLFLSEQLSPSQNLLRISLLTGGAFLVELIIMFTMVRLKLGIKFSFSLFKFDKAKELLSFGSSLLLAHIGEIFNKNTHIYIIALVVNAAQVAVFAIARQFINYMNDIILSAFGIMNPYFSRLQAQNSKDSYKSALLDSLALSYSVSCLVGLGLAFYGGLFATRWIGESFSHIGEVLAPMAFAAMLWHGETPANEFLIGLSAQQVLAKLSLAQGFFSTLLCYPCVYFWGMAGVGWLIFSTAFVFSFLIKPYYVSRVSGINLKRYYTFLLIILLPQLGTQSLYYFFIKHLLQPRYIDVILAGCGQGVVAMLTLLLSLKLTSSIRFFSSQAGMNAEERQNA